MSRRHFLFFLLLALLGWSCQSGRPLTAGQHVDFIVLQMNDVYEIAPLEGGKSGGLARVATLRQELLQETPNLLTVLSGDFLSPSFIGTLKLDNGERIAGLQMVETLNALGVDYVTFGNHEFDLSSPDLLQKRIDQSAFGYVCANVLRVRDGSAGPFTQQGKAIPPFVVREFSNAAGKAVRVGLTGVVLPFNKADYVAYEPVEETFRQTFEAMKPVTDICLAITHLAIDEDEALARAVPGMPLFLGGHDHTHMRRQVGKTLITKADANAKTVYIHRIRYHLKNGRTEIRSTLHTIDDSIADEPATKTVVDKWIGSLGQITRNMGYDINRKLMRATVVLECTEAAVRSRPTNMGRLTAEAFQAAWPGADVYLLNSGSMRLDDDLSGDITEYDVLRTYPFGGPIVQIAISGQDMTRLLQTGLVSNRSEGGYLQTLHIRWDGEALFIGEKPVEPEKIYTVVLPDFLAAGKEQNLEFLSAFPRQTRDSFTLNGTAFRNDVRDIVIQYMLLRKVYGD